MTRPDEPELCVDYGAYVGLRNAALPSLALWALIIGILYLAV